MSEKSWDPSMKVEYFVEILDLKQGTFKILTAEEAADHKSRAFRGLGSLGGFNVWERGCKRLLYPQNWGVLHLFTDKYYNKDLEKGGEKTFWQMGPEDQSAFIKIVQKILKNIEK